MPRPRIILAGATGDLGQRIARELIDRGARVRGIVRGSSDVTRVEHLRGIGVEIATH